MRGYLEMIMKTRTNRISYVDHLTVLGINGTTFIPSGSNTDTGLSRFDELECTSEFENALITSHILPIFIFHLSLSAACVNHQCRIHS